MEIKCEFCHHMFKYRRNMLKHQRLGRCPVLKLPEPSINSETLKRKNEDNNIKSMTQKRPRSDKDCRSMNALCEKCGKIFRNNYDLKRHMTSHREHTCALYTKSFDCHNALRCHMFHKHSQSGGAEPEESNEVEFDSMNDKKEEEQEPWVNENGEIDEALRDIYETHGHIIKMEHSKGNIQDIYNFHLPNGELTFDQIHDNLETIYHEQNNVFKFSFSLGFILRNIETSQLRYFYPHNNENVLLSPMLISDQEDLNELKQKLKDIDFINDAFKQRPNTKWSVYRLTNVRYVVTRLDFPLGEGVLLPDYLKNKKSIVGLAKDTKGTPYNDSLCLFRALAYHQLQSFKNLEVRVDHLVQKWPLEEKFNGVPLSKIPQFEETYDISINIFSLNEEGSAECVYKSVKSYRDQMNINLFENHCSYITSLATYCKKFKCRNCEYITKRLRDLKRHEKTCSATSFLHFPGGYHKTQTTLFQDLEAFDSVLSVPECDRYFEKFACFDYEAMLCPTSLKSSKSVWEAKHIPVSVSVCSNVDGFESPKCFVNDDVDELVSDKVKYLHNIQSTVYQSMTSKFSNIFDQLIRKINQLKKVVSRRKTDNLDSFDDDDVCMTDNTSHEEASPEFLEKLEKENHYKQYLRDLDDKYMAEDNTDNISTTDSIDSELDSSLDESDIEYDSLSESDMDDECSEDDDDLDCDMTDVPLKVLEGHLSKAKLLLTRLDEYCSQLPVISFNGSKYDLNLIKEKLAKHLELATLSKAPFIVKKGNAYSCIGTDKFKFLDMTNFLSPGVSLDKFMKAYGAILTKSFFPYEFLDSFDKLSHPDLPPYKAFYSSMKGKNVLETREYDEYSKYLQQGMPSSLILEKLKLKEIPKSGEQNWQALQALWSENKWSSLKDLLVYYNNLDTLPFTQSIETFLKFYFGEKIDVFKVAISAPGVSRILGMKTLNEGTHFSLFNQKDKSLYFKLKNSMVGGPSLVFRRSHKVGSSYIRNGKKLCGSIKGFDANALYLWAFKQELPTQWYSFRTSENDFKIQRRDRYLKEIQWLEWLMHSNPQANRIQHKMNGGQKFIPPYHVDGFQIAHPKNVIYEFHGCWAHGHKCELTKSCNQDWKDTAAEKAQQTIKRSDHLTSLGYEVRSIKECEFNKLYKEDKEMRQFINSKFKRPCDKYYRMTEDQILTHIKNGNLFGAIECDIHVPDHLKEKFSEMCPLFCTMDIEMNGMGEHMKQHMENAGISSKPRRLLVSGLKAEKLTIASPLLKWYLEHGLVVTKIYTVIEYTPSACFTKFVDLVTDKRREGDLNPDLSVLSDTFKLWGNSFYGSMIMDRTKHCSIQYILGKYKAMCKANDKRFRKLTELPDDLFEFELAKNRINLDLPVQIGFFILAYAKLKMLSFYHDCLDRYIDREDFELVQMDTDSYYLALSSAELTDLIRPDMVDEFEKEKHLWFPRDDTEAHAIYDKRTPGLFKLEAKGTEIVALNSKTYCLFDQTENTSKFSCKGVNKSQFFNPIDRYREVLDTRQTVSGINKSFRMKGNAMYTHSQTKSAFSYFYCKRIVADDGVSTSPLPVTLTPSQDNIN